MTKFLTLGDWTGHLTRPFGQVCVVVVGGHNRPHMLLQRVAQSKPSGWAVHLPGSGIKEID